MGGCRSRRGLFRFGLCFGVFLLRHNHFIVWERRDEKEIATGGKRVSPAQSDRSQFRAPRLCTRARFPAPVAASAGLLWHRQRRFRQPVCRDNTTASQSRDAPCARSHWRESTRETTTSRLRSALPWIAI